MDPHLSIFTQSNITLSEQIEEINDPNPPDISIDLPLDTISSTSPPKLKITDLLLNDSRLSPNGNGNVDYKNMNYPPTEGQKWWAAVIFGFVFGLISSPPAYFITSKITQPTVGNITMDGPGPNFIGLLLHSIIFILVVRLILW